MTESKNDLPIASNDSKSGLSIRRVMPVAVLLIATIAAGAALLPTAAGKAPVTKARMIKAYPHDKGAFCQGLVVHNGKFLEGTGQYNESRLRRVDIETGVPELQVDLPGNVFGEGVTVWKNSIIQLTWKNGYLITYDAETMNQTGTVFLRNIDPTLHQGWGITHDGQNLIISDGSHTLRFVNPDTFKVVKRITVKDDRRSVSRLNELEFVNGEIFANVWYKDQIARIDPATGRVRSWLDVTNLRPRSVRNDREAALNGIAWDPTAKRLFVTGKNWPAVFEVSF